MGVYIYTLRAKQATIQIGDIPTKANLLSYAFKPYWCDMDEQPKVFKQMITRAENFWEGKETSDCFVIGDKFENGCEVRSGWPTGKPWAYDSEWPGVHLGFLKKIGRSWTVVPTENECYGI